MRKLTSHEHLNELFVLVRAQNAQQLLFITHTYLLRWQLKPSDYIIIQPKPLLIYLIRIFYKTDEALFWVDQRRRKHTAESFCM